MKRGSVLLVIGVTALLAYSVGRQDGPTQRPSPSSAPIFKPVSFVESPLETARQAPMAAPSPAAPIPSAATPKSAVSPPQSATVSTPPPAAVNVPAKKPDVSVKRRTEEVLTVAAIAAIIIEASRAQYHDGGRPCACPDDRMRNGRSCGKVSAYSRPGGAAPLCYSHDVTAEMVDAYRKQSQASR